MASRVTAIRAPAASAMHVASASSSRAIRPRTTTGRSDASSSARTFAAAPSAGRAGAVSDCSAEEGTYAGPSAACSVRSLGTSRTTGTERVLARWNARCTSSATVVAALTGTNSASQD